ncbi:uncharacterized protein LOC141857699 isoform X2 [Brevipalpus obovatus]|uniref:uncharacterized protein LOC141857699 isoform X2 n=1 Tax=Brevipalpus obovatus TaxID=246614 RepID=UPI003D9ED628
MSAVDMDLNDPELEKAATKIQATFKGYMVRREVKGDKPSDGKKDAEEILQCGDSVDIDLNDPDVEKAATRIQATFRGYKSRQEVRKTGN